MKKIEFEYYILLIIFGFKIYTLFAIFKKKKSLSSGLRSNFPRSCLRRHISIHILIILYQILRHNSFCFSPSYLINLHNLIPLIHRKSIFLRQNLLIIYNTGRNIRRMPVFIKHPLLNHFLGCIKLAFH